MKHSFYLATAAIVLLASCSKPFKKAEGGMEYKIISDNKGKKIQNGNFFELQINQEYKGSNKDTVLMSSKDFPNQVVPLDSNSIPPVYYKIFAQARKGDSIVVKQLTDSIMKQAQGQAPPFMKKGAHIFASYKIINVFETKEQADSAYKAQIVLAKAKDSVKALEQIKLDDKAITEYLSKNKITAVKAPAGTYVQIMTPGEGDAIDTSKVLKIRYTGKPLAGGAPFDSNVDPKFGRTDLLQVDMNAEPGSRGSVIKGMTDGLSLLKKGAKANFYIPSALAYGSRGAGADIKPNANLIFEIEVVDVIPQAQAREEAMEEQKKMQAMQQKMMDSIQQARKGAGNK
jgi:FKBP-type peptidyl-prolyl cis-trans isomerase FkpA